MPKQRIHNEQGLIYVYFQRLPGQEHDPRYLSIQKQITQGFPKSIGFGLTRLPVAGELLQVDRFLWQVHQVIHQQVRQEQDPDDLFADLPAQVATVDLSFYGAVG